MTLDELRDICTANPYLYCHDSTRGPGLSLQGQELPAGPVCYVSVYAARGSGDHLTYPDDVAGWAPNDLLAWLRLRLGGLSRRGKEQFVTMGFGDGN